MLDFNPDSFIYQQKLMLEKVTQNSNVDSSGLVLLLQGVMWNLVSLQRHGGGPCFFSADSVKNYRSARFRKNKIYWKYIFRRRQAMPRKVAALWNLGGEKQKIEYAPKEGWVSVKSCNRAEVGRFVYIWAVMGPYKGGTRWSSCEVTLTDGWLLYNLLLSTHALT